MVNFSDRCNNICTIKCDDNDKNKNAERYRFLSLSLTALTVCAFYFDGVSRVIKEDWGGLMDIMPTMNKALWILVILSIAVNSVSIFKKKRLNKN